MTSSLQTSASISADGALGVIPSSPTPPLPDDERLQSVREGIAAGRDLGIWAEVVQVIDAIMALRAVDARIVAAVQRIAEQAAAALAKVRADATTAITNTNQVIAATQDAARTANAQLRADATAAISNEATTRSTADTSLQTSITTVNTNATNAITADRARLTTVEGAINNASTGILKRLTTIEARLAAAGIP